MEIAIDISYFMFQKVPFLEFLQKGVAPLGVFRPDLGHLLAAHTCESRWLATQGLLVVQNGGVPVPFPVSICISIIPDPQRYRFEQLVHRFGSGMCGSRAAFQFQRVIVWLWMRIRSLVVVIAANGSSWHRASTFVVETVFGHLI